MGEDEIASLTKGKVLIQAKKYEDAIKCFNRAIRFNPEYAEAWNEKGNVLLILGKIDEAIECFTKATEVNEEYITAWKGKEAALLMENKYDEALECLEHITEIDPENEEVWATKALVLSKIHRFDEAEKCRRRIEEIKKGIPMKKTKRITKKICLVGDPAVGKTSLIRRYVYDIFDNKYLSTIGAKITKKVVNIKEETHDTEIVLMIWDIEGQKKVSSVHSRYYKGADATIVVCDVTAKETLESIPNWVNAVFKVTGKIPLVFLANKIDLPNREISESEIKKVASEFNAPYFFTSAKVGKNVEDAFITISKLLLKENKI
ncbi:MAG: GTP-binding protein [Thermoplasmatales archaeon]|nr:GTP-binding protein [Thermoplasmatales archaeon]